MAVLEAVECPAVFIACCKTVDNTVVIHTPGKCCRLHLHASAIKGDLVVSDLPDITFKGVLHTSNNKGTPRNTKNILGVREQIET